MTAEDAAAIRWTNFAGHLRTPPHGRVFATPHHLKEYRSWNFGLIRVGYSINGKPLASPR